MTCNSFGRMIKTDSAGNWYMTETYYAGCNFLDNEIQKLEQIMCFAQMIPWRDITQMREAVVFLHLKNEQWKNCDLSFRLGDELGVLIVEPVHEVFRLNELPSTQAQCLIRYAKKISPLSIDTGKMTEILKMLRKDYPLI